MSTCAGAAAQEFQLEDVPAAASVPIAQIKPRTIIFADQRNDKLANSSTGLHSIRRLGPLTSGSAALPLALPELREPALNQQTKLKLSVYQAEARFRLPRPAAALDLSRYANVAFLEQIDPAVKHRPITAGDAVPDEDAGAAHNRPANRRWCEDAKAICVQSRYMFEGKIPAGVACQQPARGRAKGPCRISIEPSERDGSFHAGRTFRAAKAWTG